MVQETEMKMDNIKICVVGLGYVGLPLALTFGKKKKVIGFDINEKKCEQRTGLLPLSF